MSRGIAAAAALITTAAMLTGCGTALTEPWNDLFEPSPERKALELADFACWLAGREGMTQAESQDLAPGQWAFVMWESGKYASRAAYFDSRWRTLADAFPRAQAYWMLETYDSLSAESLALRRELVADKYLVEYECRAVRDLINRPFGTPADYSHSVEPDWLREALEAD